MTFQFDEKNIKKKGGAKTQKYLSAATMMTHLHLQVLYYQKNLLCYNDIFLKSVLWICIGFSADPVPEILGQCAF
jgi:hypothetical protein